jgi:hypothetical protein
MEQLNVFSVEQGPDGAEIRTRGLAAFGLPEMYLSVPVPALDQASRALLQTLGSYALSHQKPLGVGHKISHGYWILTLRPRADGGLDIYESAPEGRDFVQGAQLTLRYWIEQSEACRNAGADFSPPQPDQKAAVSVGVLEGDLPVWGSRYPAPAHMSGWYLTAERFSGDVKDLRVEHLHHVTTRRPDLARFLALPAGFRFEVTKLGSTTSFDEELLKDV